MYLFSKELHSEQIFSIFALQLYSRVLTVYAEFFSSVEISFSIITSWPPASYCCMDPDLYKIGLDPDPYHMMRIQENKFPDRWLKL